MYRYIVGLESALAITKLLIERASERNFTTEDKGESLKGAEGGCGDDDRTSLINSIKMPRLFSRFSLGFTKKHSLSPLDVKISYRLTIVKIASTFAF